MLSSSTQTYDRTTKLDAYQRLSSLQAYVLVHQHEAQADVFWRREGGFELTEQYGRVLELPQGLRVDLDAL